MKVGVLAPLSRLMKGWSPFTVGTRTPRPIRSVEFTQQFSPGAFSKSSRHKISAAVCFSADSWKAVIPELRISRKALANAMTFTMAGVPASNWSGDFAQMTQPAKQVSPFRRRSGRGRRPTMPPFDRQGPHAQRQADVFARQAVITLRLRGRSATPLAGAYKIRSFIGLCSVSGIPARCPAPVRTTASSPAGCARCPDGHWSKSPALPARCSLTR